MGIQVGGTPRTPGIRSCCISFLLNPSSGSARPLQVGELDEVALADTATVPKSQGLEYPAVVIPLSTQPDPMLERNLFDTGVTRGKPFGVIIGQPRALGLAVRTVKSRRLTHLSARRQPYCRDSGIARE